MNKKILVWLSTPIILASAVLAEGNLFNIFNFGELGSAISIIGSVFANLGNFIMWLFYAMGFWIMTALFLAIVWFFFLYLPLKIYPTFVQYYNLYQIIFGKKSEL